MNTPDGSNTYNNKIQREKFIKATHVNITIHQYIINFIYTCGRLPEKAYTQQAGHLKNKIKKLTKNENNVYTIQYNQFHLSVTD